MRALRAEGLKLCHTAFYPIAVGLPLVVATVFLVYYTWAGGSDATKVAVYVELLGMAAPFAVALLVSTSVEVETAGHFQQLLSGARGRVLHAKGLWLLFWTALAFVGAMGIFSAGFAWLLDKDGLDFGATMAVAGALWLGAVPMVMEHLFLNLRVGKVASLAVSACEMVIAALFMTGLGEGLWPLVPCSYSARLGMYQTIEAFMPEREMLTTLPWVSVLIMAGFYIIIIVWFKRFEGRPFHD